MFYCAAQFIGAIAGVALASFVLQGAPMDKAVHYAATMPGVDGDTIAFVAELAISFISMSACMLAAAEVFLLARESKRPYCAKLHHHNDKRCIFRHSGLDPTARAAQAAHYA